MVQPVERIHFVASEYERSQSALKIAATTCADYGLSVVDDSHSAVDLVVSLGGDGTLLRASRVAVRHGCPLVGVHYGTLGFLTAYTNDELLTMLADAKAGQLSTTRRMLMVAELWRDGERVFAEWAANDCYVKHGASPRMLKLVAHVNGQQMAEYSADGLIVSTPSGSTAYNLAAGGPILDTDMKAFVMTPICAHSLTHRPAVISGDKEVCVVFEAPSTGGYLHVDGQYQIEVRPGDRVVFRQADRTLQLVDQKASVFKVLRAKKNWSN